MPEAGPVVTDTGPLIALAAIKQLELLAALYGQVLIPSAVMQEVAAGRERPAASEIEDAKWAVKTVVSAELDPLLADELGAGEAAAIALARATRARLVLLDDRRARRVARLAYGLKVKGVAGILVQAKRGGFIPEVTASLLELRAQGYYLSDRVIARARREAGEARTQDGAP